MKKLLYVLIMTGLLLTGCGSSAKQEMTDIAANTQNESLLDVYTNISALTDTKMVILDESMIENYYGIQVSDLDEYIFAQAESPTSAEMIIMARAKDGIDISIYKNNIDNVIEQKTDEMKNYNEPDQAELLDNVERKFSDKALYVVVSDKADVMADTIENSLGF